MEAADIISLIKDVLLGLSAIAVAVFAWLGLAVWRRELTGKAKFEIARNMMKLALAVKAYFHDVRNIFTQSSEWMGRVKEENERSDVSQVLNEWYARANRLKPLAENLNKMIEIQWESEILLNNKSIKPIIEAVDLYRKCYAELASSISFYFDTRKNEALTGIPYKDQEWLQGLHKTIYSIGKDEFSEKIDEATDGLSSALKQYVK